MRLAELAGQAEPPSWAWVEPGAGEGHAALSTLGARFRARRAATVRHVTVLDEAGWGRWGIHAVYGRLDVAGLIRIAIEHDAEHLAELRRRA